MNTTGRRARRASRSSAAPSWSGPDAPSAAGVVVGGRRAIAAAMPGGQPPPAAVEVDEDLLDRVARASSSASAIAVPDTTDTSCSADGPPSRTTTGAPGRRSCRRLPARPVADELDLEGEVDAVPGEDLGPDVLGQAADVGGASPSGR